MKKLPNKNSNFLSRILSHKKLPQIAFVVVFAAIGCYAVLTSFAANNNAPPRPFVDEPARGLIWAGLKAPQAGGPCGELFEVANVRAKRPLCTHGPDPAPEGLDVRDGTPQNAASIATTAATDPPPPIPCDGDGRSGNRVEGLYVRPSDVPSRLSIVAGNLQDYAKRANNQYLRSAQETGGQRNLRWVHDATCNPIIPEVVISPTGDDNFQNTIIELSNKGYNRSDRKYMIWMDSATYCGIGSIWGDDRPGSENYNNGFDASYARVDAGCWDYAEAHELMHNLGGVQNSAPHSTGGYHCTDGNDVMCYADREGVVITYPCSGRDWSLFDCNHDDYYYAGTPPSTNYLATHWNTANSSFLMGGITTTPVQCNNGRDDDADGKIDYPADPGCANSTDTSESPDPPPPGDTISPTVNIVSPLNNANVKRQVGISANGFDNVRVTKMQIYVGLGLKHTTSGSPISYTWNTNKVTPGPYTITVKAWDAAGNLGQSSITVNVVGR